MKKKRETRRDERRSSVIIEEQLPYLYSHKPNRKNDSRKEKKTKRMTSLLCSYLLGFLLMGIQRTLHLWLKYSRWNSFLFSGFNRVQYNAHWRWIMKINVPSRKVNQNENKRISSSFSWLQLKKREREREEKKNRNETSKNVINASSSSFLGLSRKHSMFP